MSKVKKYFNQALYEANIPEQPISDEDAFNNAMDSNTNPETFNTEPMAPGYQSKYIEKAKKWMTKINDFSDWLNGTENSLNKFFVELDHEGSPFAGISSDSKMLTRIAGDLAELEQKIAGYVIRSRKEPDSTE